MNIGSVLNRLSPVQGTYRSINYEYIWAATGMYGDSPPRSQYAQKDSVTGIQDKVLPWLRIRKLLFQPAVVHSKPLNA